MHPEAQAPLRSTPGRVEGGRQPWRAAGWGQVPQAPWDVCDSTLCSQMHACTQTCMCVHTRTHAHMHICTHTQAFTHSSRGGSARTEGGVTSAQGPQQTSRWTSRALPRGQLAAQGLTSQLCPVCLRYPGTSSPRVRSLLWAEPRLPCPRDSQPQPEVALGTR